MRMKGEINRLVQSSLRLKPGKVECFWSDYVRFAAVWFLTGSINLSALVGAKGSDA